MSLLKFHRKCCQICKISKRWLLILLLVVIFVYVSLLFNVILKFKSLPACIYGCDYYYEQGVIYHLLREGADGFGKSSVHLGNAPTTPQFYYIFPAVTSYIFEISPFKSEAFLNFLWIILTFILFYNFFSYLFKEETFLDFLKKRDYFVLLFSILSTVVAVQFVRFPIYKYTEFAYFISLPLFLFAVLKFRKKKNLKNSLFLGTTIGICGLSHYALFFIAFEVIFLLFLFDNLSIRGKNLKIKVNLSEIKFFLISITLGFLISLIFWYRPLFIFHGELTAYGFNLKDFTNRNVYISFLLTSLRSFFFNTNNVLSITLGILNILGLCYIIRESSKFLKFLIFSLFFCIYNYLFLVPLLGKHLSPEHCLYFLSPIIIGILTKYGIEFILKVSLRFEKEAVPLVVIFIIVLTISLVLNNIILFKKKVTENRFFVNSYRPIPEPYRSLQTFLLSNISANDVVLTTNELCFALNGISGIKCLLYRRGHSSKFDDLDRIYLDAAIILYGNDTKKKLELIRKYNVSYLYWDINWISTEYYIDPSGRIIGWFDPITILYSPEREKILKKYNISYFILNTWLDPAFRSEDYKKFKIIFISPENYRSFYKPWKPDLDQYLQKIWEYKQENKTMAVLYKINSIIIMK